jgi:hypothetical protein
MNRAINTPSTKQAGICGIDYHVHILFRDVANPHGHATVEKRLYYFRAIHNSTANLQNRETHSRFLGNMLCWHTSLIANRKSSAPQTGTRCFSRR